MAETGKRTLDFLIAFLGLILFLPACLLIALAIRLDSPGPVLYWSRRMGRHGWPFLMLKFRTMLQDEGAQGFVTLDDDPRITAVGRVLRRRKLDELPQLWNILKGEMSLVGPRPQVPTLVSRYSRDQLRALEALPGLTDPASLRFWDEGRELKGASDPDAVYLRRILPEKLALSLDYQRARSFASDVRVLLATALACVGLGQQARIARASVSTTLS